MKGANVTGYSAIGQREENEDAYAWTGEGEPRLFLLADGMGGAAAGEVASRTAVEAAQAMFAERMSQAGRDPGPCLVDAIWLGADCLVKVASRAAPWLRGMGSTLVAITLLPLGTHSPGRVPCYVANVGDSRCYALLSGELRQVTQDHTIAEATFRGGGMTREEADRSPMRNRLTQAVGLLEGPEEVDVFVLSLLPGDVILLCSDGLHGVLPDERIAELLRDPATDAQRLVEEVEALGIDDNCTAVVVRV